MCERIDTDPPARFSYCGSPEPTDECERGGWCDYHAGLMPGGPDPWRGQIVPFAFASDPALIPSWAESAADYGD
jgi:hypothetical protein